MSLVAGGRGLVTKAVSVVCERVLASCMGTLFTYGQLSSHPFCVADSKKLYKSNLLDDLEDISTASGQDFVAFGDSAYPLHRFFSHVLKCPKGGSLTRQERLFNALNARFRLFFLHTRANMHALHISCNHFRLSVMLLAPYVFHSPLCCLILLQ